MAEKPCLKCDSMISETAEKCPYCGYEPSAEGRLLRKFMLFFGGLLTASVVGAIIGIPMILLALLSSRKVGDRKPTTYNPS